MSGPISSDIQSLFDSRASTRDFLGASKIEDGIGLCLSGGGYRAMIYHVGVLVRLNELGFLPRLQEISSVSGGSITAGMLACAWSALTIDENGVAVNLWGKVCDPLLRFSKIGIDVKAALWSLLPGKTAADYIANAYDKYLFKGATLQALPDTPRFTFMCTNLQTGSGWRFAKNYAADHRVGRIDKPQLLLSRVVAASSAFPPVLSPVKLEFEPGSVIPTEGADLHKSPYTERAVLTDGGVYDNLGLERVWRRCRIVLVSNAGRNTPEIGSPTGRWMGQLFRTLHLVQQQAENSRRRMLFGMNNLGHRRVAYWSIDTPIEAYGVSDALDLHSEAAKQSSTIRTRLNPFSDDEISLLLRSGYAGADASLRKNDLAKNSPPADFKVLAKSVKPRA